MFSVNYLGGAQPTFTFNFSRPSDMIQAPFYNFVRLGRRGYTSVVENMLANARYLNRGWRRRIGSRSSTPACPSRWSPSG